MGDHADEPIMKRSAQESALSNDIILNCICKHLIRREGSDKDICAVRLVSEKWRNVMTKLSRKVRKPTRFTSCNNPGWPLDFVSIMSKSKLVPVQQYNFYKTFFHRPDSFQLFSRILLAVGNSMVSLRLEVLPHQLKLHAVENLVNVKMANLETLCIDILHYSPARRTLVSPIGLLLNSAPHLREFKLTYCSMDESVEEDELGTNYLKDRTLEMVCKRLPKSVKSLDISGMLMGKRAANLLLRTGPRLTHLGIEIHPDRETMSSVESLLASQDRILSSLHICGHPTEQRDGDLFHFPVLHELTSLTFMGLDAALFSAATTFPKLKLFDAYGMNIELFSSLVKQLPVAPAIKELQLPYDLARHPHLVRPLSTHFPAISNLYIELLSISNEGVNTMRNIFTHLPNIEGLYLYLDIMPEGGGGGHSTLNLDSLFSGIEESICKRLRWGGRVDNASTIQELVTCPSLLNMGRLQRLHIECRRLPASHGLILTNLAADHVFLSMPSLRELIIPNTMFTEECIEQMKEKLLNFSFQTDFTRWDGDDYSGEEGEEEEGDD